MTGYSFSTPVWDGGTWVTPVVTNVTTAARKANGPEDQHRNAPAEWDKIDVAIQPGRTAAGSQGPLVNNWVSASSASMPHLAAVDR